MRKEKKEEKKKEENNIPKYKFRPRFNELLYPKSGTF